MPPRSTVYQVDEVTRLELDRRIVAAGYGGYAGHAEWLAGLGYTISEAALHRYGRNLRERLKRDPGARHMAAAVRAVAGANNDAALDMAERTAAKLLERICEMVESPGVPAESLQAMSCSLRATVGAIAAVRELKG